MNKCPSWLTWLYLAMIIPFPFIDASPIRKISLAPMVTAPFCQWSWPGREKGSMKT